MDNINFFTFSTTRTTDRLLCVWVPTGSPRTPLACVWLEDKYYPKDCTLRVSSFEKVEKKETGRMHLCV